MMSRKSSAPRPLQVPRCTNHPASNANGAENAAAASPYASVLRSATPLAPEKMNAKWVVENAVFTGKVRVKALTTSDP